MVEDDSIVRIVGNGKRNESEVAFLIFYYGGDLERVYKGIERVEVWD